MDRIELRIAKSGGGIPLEAAITGGGITLDSERVREVYADRDVYDGEYSVTPSLDVQILDTGGKVMRSDVVVMDIPYYETSNPQGGYTAIIGGN